MEKKTNVISLDEYRQCNNLEEDYLKFLSHVNKFIKPPTSIPETIKIFYLILRYLEGTINAFSILTLVKRVPPEMITETKEMVINHLQSLIDDLKQY